jgi:two-component system response regulator NreC
MPSTILLADDHASVREALAAVIDSEPDLDVVATAANGRDAVRLALQHQPDVAVLDLSMPEMNGMAAAAAIRSASPRTAILALTRHADEAYVLSLLRAGAAGYVLKQSPSSELLKAIRTAAAGRRYLDPTLEPSLWQRSSADGLPGGTTPTHREKQVLQRLALGLSNKEIANELDISVKTVEVHKGNGMKRLGLRSRSDLVRFALLHGWLRDP